MTTAPDPAPISFEAAGLRWWAKPGYEAFIREALAPACREPERAADAVLVKRNRVRTVARLPGPEGELFCKRFRVLRPGTRLLHLVKPSPARREWAVLRHLRAAGVACPEPVLLGEERARGLLAGSVLATRAIDDAEEATLVVERLRAAGEVEARRRLLESLAAAADALLRAGLDHPDLHLGNFLVRADGGLVALDMHSARVRARPLGAAAAARRLGKLAHSLGFCLPVAPPEARQELTWFAAAYARLDPRWPEADGLEAALLARAEALEQVRRVSRGKRCVVSSTGYAVEGPWTRRVFRRREMSAAAVEAALAAPALESIHLHRRGRSRLETVAAPDGVDAPGGVLLRKVYLFPRGGHRLIGACAPRALRAWRATLACELRAAPVPRAYALVCEGWPLPRRAVLLMEHVPAANLEAVLRDDPPPPAGRRSLARDYGRLLGRFHASGLSHGDLAPQNVLARPRRAGVGPADGAAGWDLWLLGLEDVSARAMSREERLQALTDVADTSGATRADRLRFFRAYLEAGGSEVLAPELAALGLAGLSACVAERLAERRARRARQAAQPAASAGAGAAARP